MTWITLSTAILANTLADVFPDVSAGELQRDCRRVVYDAYDTLRDKYMAREDVQEEKSQENNRA